MKKIVRKLWREETIRTITTLIIGAVVGKFIDSIVVSDVSLPGWIFFGFSGVAFLILSVAFLALRNDTKRLIERSGILVEIVEERIDPDGVIAGNVYAKLADLVRNAEKEILIFNYPRKVRVQSLDSEHPKIRTSRKKRLEWLRAELETLRQQIGEDFKYVMIIQTPEESTPLFEIVDEDIANSIREALTLQAKNQYPGYVVDIRRSNTEFVNPFMLVDERYLTVPLYGIHDGVMYIDKILVFDDREHRLINTFKTYFETMERKSIGVSLRDVLEPATKQGTG